MCSAHARARRVTLGGVLGLCGLNRFSRPRCPVCRLGVIGRTGQRGLYRCKGRGADAAPCGLSGDVVSLVMAGMTGGVFTRRGDARGWIDRLYAQHGWRAVFEREGV